MNEEKSEEQLHSWQKKDAKRTKWINENMNMQPEIKEKTKLVKVIK